MASLSSILGIVSTVAGVAGTVISAAGTIAAGRAQQEAKEFEAKQLEIAGQEERAASQREALTKRRERDFLISRQQAVAASSGLGALDDTVLELAGDITDEASYQEGMIRYGGEERARGRRAQAGAARLEGDAAMKGAQYSAAGTIIGGIGSFAKSYAQSAFKSTAGSGNYRYG